MADEEKTKISWQRYLLHNQSNTQALMDVTDNNSFALLFTINICMRLFDSKAKDLFTVAIQSFFPPIAAHKAWPNEETLLRKQYFLGLAKLVACDSRLLPSEKNRGEKLVSPIFFWREEAAVTGY